MNFLFLFYELFVLFEWFMTFLFYLKLPWMMHLFIQNRFKIFF